MLEEVKIALRIKTQSFDGEINGLIEACKKDLSKAGVSAIEETDPLIKRAIILYAKADFGYDNPDSEKFRKAYENLRGKLALSREYNGGGNG